MSQLQLYCNKTNSFIVKGTVNMRQKLCLKIGWEDMYRKGWLSEVNSQKRLALNTFTFSNSFVYVVISFFNWSLNHFSGTGVNRLGII